MVKIIAILKAKKNLFFAFLLLSLFSFAQPSSDALEFDQYSRAYKSTTPSYWGSDFSVETWVVLRDESCPNASGAGNSSSPGHNSNDVFVSVADHENTNGDALHGFEIGIQSSASKMVGPSSSQSGSEDKFYFVVGNGTNSAIVYSNFTNTAWRSNSNGYSSTSSWGSSNSVGIPKCNTWYHVAGVYDHSASQIKLYINGSLQGSASTSSAAPTTNPRSGIALGSEATRSDNCTSCSNGNVSGFLDGGLDNVAIWNTDKSSTYSGSSNGSPNYQRTISTSASGLITYYDFDQTNQNAATSSSSGSDVVDDKGSINIDLYKTTGSGSKYNCGSVNGHTNTCRNSSNGSISYTPNSSLPVSLLHFKAIKLLNSSVQLDWATASEINNSHFTIEKSMDAINWQFVEDIRGAGNSSTINHYQSIDYNPYPGISYYRLKQTDFDGAFEYFPIQSAGDEGPESQLEISPNPVENILRINVSQNPNQSIIVLNNQGLNLNHMTDVIEKGDHYSLLDVSRLNSGIYFLWTGYQAVKFSKK
jgi:flavin-binding protein dodecin